VRQFSEVLGNGINTNAANNLNAQSTTTNGTDVSKTVIGTSATLTATGINTLFGDVGAATSTLFSLLTVVGLDSGARVQVPINITKT
jgi:ABC-type enterochelin transport system ATPase subunit